MKKFKHIDGWGIRQTNAQKRAKRKVAKRRKHQRKQAHGLRKAR